MKSSSQRNLLIAYEGGGSRTRILLADWTGAVLAREFGGPASGLYTNGTDYRETARERLARLREAADGIGGRVALAGLAGPMNLQAVEGAIADVFGPLPLVRFGEGDIALALYGLEWGVSLVAGTGSSCRAIDTRGKMASCGGFGPQFGDDGSGYWIGRAGVAAVMLADDGRGPRTSLREKLLAHFELGRPWDILRMIDRSGHVSGTKIAGFTPSVFAAAREGDAAARGICRAAGTRLGKLIVATLAKLDWREPRAQLVLTGGVFHGADLILPPFKRALRKYPAVFDILPPAPDPTEGIVRLILARHAQTPTAQ